MPTTISKIKLFNYKRFREYTFIPNARLNVLIGDNEVGKSSILEAIDLVSSGSSHRIESIGIDRLLNIDSVNDFLHGPRSFQYLPKLMIELYLSGQFDHTMNGKNNTDATECDGIRLICEPNIDYSAEIASALLSDPNYFPYEYYSIRFSTFADEGYSGYKKKIRTVTIDSSNIKSEYATNDFIHRMYHKYTNDNTSERVTHKAEYRKLKDYYANTILKEFNERIKADKAYEFRLRNQSFIEFENDLMIFDNNIGIDNKGTGRQVFIKTDFALDKAGNNIDVIMIEEPENHLSPINLRRLVQLIIDAQNGQIFVTTHNNLIITRLKLNNLFALLLTSETSPITLRNLCDDTAKYFLKSPPASVLEFVLSNKSFLVEGPSEYMLLERFYYSIRGCSPEDDGVYIINIRGLSFKRYLDISKLTKNKVAVITDNDYNYQKNCIEKYKDYTYDDNISIFFEKDNNQHTFEVTLYKSNMDLCTKLFGSEAENYMLNNKTEAAYQLLSQKHAIHVPDYIKEAIDWISE